ncbi:28924_t:CDS:1 [Gigaspora margarita]|uniref:28924_t:CDS:1 n=1 Tax=Gigaspora margarita TaxID=4874 RepID=A0ABN7VSV6_GIGMA|nr:28924_t:CDS:1 [Gigaspora margarita]
MCPTFKKLSRYNEMSWCHNCCCLRYAKIWKLNVAITSTIVAFVFHSAISTTNYASIDYIWSIITGNGTISAFIAIYYQLTVPESQRYTMDIESSINKSATSKSTTDMSTT